MRRRLHLDGTHLDGHLRMELHRLLLLLSHGSLLSLTTRYERLVRGEWSLRSHWPHE
jgi:hypothetical protein